MQRHEQGWGNDSVGPAGLDWHTPAHEPTGPFARIAAAEPACQHGLVTTSQLLAHGLTPSSISRWSRVGLLDRITQGIYRLPGYPETWRQRLLAAVLAGPAGTVASHRSAAALHGFRRYDTDVIEVSCCRWRRARLPDVIVHESLAAAAVDATVIDSIPVTDPVRTIIDLGAVSHPYKIGLALDEARRRGQVRLGDVRARLDQLAVQGRNGIVAIRLLLDERAGVELASTGFEQLLTNLVVEFHLPRPIQQLEVRTKGATYYLDFAYPDVGLAIEMDSEEYHLDLDTFHNDRARQNALVLAGWRFLRFTKRHLRHERSRVASQIASALRPPKN